MTYADAESFLLNLPRFAGQADAAYKPGFERIEALLAAMGHPHRAYPAVHVAGTNGKGSTASMTAALLGAHGLRVGLHTSPHLWHLAERLRVDGQPAPEAWVAHAVARYAAEMTRIGPSFFEALVALSLFYFAEQRVDVAVVEVGLGGRLDATSVVDAAVSLVTSIALDHTDLLGDTLGAIAREKAGIFRPGVPAFTCAAAPEALAALRDVARAKGTPLEAVGERAHIEAAKGALAIQTPHARYAGLHLDLGGAHQAAHAALALRAAETFTGGPLDPGAVRAALADVRRRAGLRARLEWDATGQVLVDVAHNPAGIEAALAEAARRCTGRLTVLLGLMRDKDGAAVAQALARSGATVVAVSAGGARAFSATELAHLVRAAGARVQVAEDVGSAFAAQRKALRAGDVLLVTGSHGVVEALGPAFFSETRRNP